MYQLLTNRACYSEVPLILSVQEVKAAILEDIVRLGKEGGLKSFEQVQHSLIIQQRFETSMFNI